MFFSDTFQSLDLKPIKLFLKEVSNDSTKPPSQSSEKTTMASTMNIALFSFVSTLKQCFLLYREAFYSFIIDKRISYFLPNKTSNIPEKNKSCKKYCTYLGLAQSYIYNIYNANTEGNVKNKPTKKSFQCNGTSSCHSQFINLP